MIRQISLRAAVAAPRRLLLAPGPRPSSFTTTRLLSTETTTTAQAATLPPASPARPTSASIPPPTKPRQLTYLVERTASNNVSVYNEKRSGGTRKETVIKHIVGNIQDLKKDIIAEMKFKKDDVNINPVTNHIKIKVRRD